MNEVTLLAVLAAVTVGILVKRMARLSAPRQLSTFEKTLAVHIADTTRSAGRSL